MSASREPLLTLSPSQHMHIGASSTEGSLKTVKSPPQTTPTLPRRERLASFSRLLKNEKFAEYTRNLKKSAVNKREQIINCGLESPVDIHVSPCSPSKRNGLLKSNDSFLMPEKGYLDFFF